MPAHAVPSQPQFIATSAAALESSISSLVSSSASPHKMSSSQHYDFDTSSNLHLSHNRESSNNSPRSSGGVTEQFSCQESYALFKKCSTNRETEGFSCSDAVATYMRCALSGC
mmetsp:Transcript_28785/g.60770  ORF Transcript_28785/g.60770 Transcript_28785/m.60770 type:complete len:113 (+) Transcript_28785:261-599(+)